MQGLLPRPLRLAGVFVLACVADIPSSVVVDFSQEQLGCMASGEGHCEVAFWPCVEAGTPSEKQMWRLNRTYTDSYAHFPPMASLGLGLHCPVLLIHGEADIHVPYKDHAPQLLAMLRKQHPHAARSGSSQDHEACVQLQGIKGGNHFLSSSKAMKTCLRCIETFVRNVGAQ